jgi:ubiquinone/menaquinone biosynthesis C-methylase UbiE
VLDAGCGEGVLVDEFAGHLAITGVDANYASAHVTTGSLLALPFADGGFPRALCLDVLEHLSYEDQPRALAELHRVLAPGGELLVSVPNLAHLQSRVQFLLRGRLIRTASEIKHPGDRPVFEYLQLARRAGFALVQRRGIFPTIPIVTHLVRKHPQALAPLHRALTALLPIPGWCFLNLLTFRKA